MGEDLNIPFNFSLGDRSAIDAAKETRGLLVDVRKQVDDAVAKGGVDAIAGGAMQLRKVNAEINLLENALAETIQRAAKAREEIASVEKGTKEWRDLRREILKSEKAITDYSARLEKIPGTLKPALETPTGLVGRGDTALASVAGLAGAFGGGAGTEALMIGSDILGVADAMGELSETLRDMPGFIGGVANAGAALAGILPGVSAGMGAVLAVAAPVAAGIVGVVAAFNQIQSNAKKAREEMEKELETRRRLLVLSGEIQNATRDEVQERIDQLNQQIQDEQALIAQAQTDRETLETDHYKRLGMFVHVFESGAEAQIDAIEEDIKNSTNAVEGYTAELNELYAARDDDLRAVNDAIAAERELAESRREEADIMRSATAEGVQKRIDVTREELELQREHIARLEEVRAGTEEGTNAYEQISQEIIAASEETDNLTQHLEFLEGAAMNAARANDAAAEALEKEREAAEEAAKAAEETREKMREAYEYGQQQLADIADTTQKYNDEIAKINEDKLKALADLEQRYSDTLVSIAEKAADDAEAAYRALQDEIASANLDIQRDAAEATREAGREDLQAKLDFQREEAKAARDHARDMKRIREDAAAAEFDMIASRDFAALLRSRLSTSRALERAAGDYGVEGQERRLAFDQERADTQRQRETERQERLIDYQQRIADARAAYQVERAEINQQRQDALAEAKQAYDRETALAKNAAEQALQVRAAGYREEIRMLAMTQGQRLQIEAETQRALLLQAQRTTQFMNQMLGSLPALGGGGGNTTHNNANVTQNFNLQAGAQGLLQMLGRMAAGEAQKIITGVMG